MSGNTVVVSVLADTARFKKEMGGLGSAFNSLKTGVKVAGAAIATGIVAAGAFATKLASDYEQTIGAMNVMLGESVTKNLGIWNDGLANTIGVSKSAAAQIQKGAALTVRALGLEGDASTAFLKTHTTNMADVAAMHNATAEQVAEAHSAVMRGEYDSAEKYGVQITAEMVKRKAASEGLTEVQARQALWTEKTAIANGHASEEANSLAGQQERLRAVLENVGLTVGTALVPAITNAVTKMVEFATKVGESAEFKAFIAWIQDTAIPAFQSFATEVVDGVVKGLTDLSNWYNENKDIINTLAVMVGAAAAVWAIWTGALAVWTAVTTLATGAQALFNAVMAANPVMLVVMAIAALVAGLVYFFTQTETGKAVWKSFTATLTSVWNQFTGFMGKAWETIKRAFSDGVSAVKKFMDDAKNKITAAWNAVLAFFAGIPGKVKAVFSAAGQWLLTAGRNIINGLKSGVTNAWGAVSSWFGGIAGRVRSALGNAGSMLTSAGRAIIDGFFSGLKASWGKVTDFVGGIASWIRNNKGPLSYDYKLLQPAGKAIMGGFGDSLAAGFSEVQNMVSGFGPALSGDLAGGFAGEVALAPAGSGGVGLGGTYYSFDGMTFQTANAEEARVLSEFAALARRKTRAGV